MVVVVKKVKKKVKKFDIMEKNRPKYFFFIGRGYFDQKLPGELDENGPEALLGLILSVKW